ncbi:hypothetical protein GIS00_21155 [Nakamurella sp. YIM 132087]|uniref:LytR/CpsA/Psr regulator C-terminal domain-containing protein n=1 Tax=Nakamurella alba TaxID=2665158 RepID=A0A7K1FQM4_9ACTN|nr:LytR C-terminal domain-containing protein [Nakamurella alba]MTD16448.1 hypothetical protein [Nakamurella alba]
MSTDTAPERYHRRRRWPILTVVVVLLAGTGFIWFQVLKPGPAAATGCNQPGPAPSTTSQTSRSATSSRAASSSRSTGTAASTPRTSAPGSSRSGSASGSASGTATTASVSTTLGSFLAASALRDTRPANPEQIALQVFNASTTRGLARTVTTELQAAGFSSIKAGANDVLYPAGDLVCSSEIRFGPAGLAQARTVLIVAPCAQLVQDDRFDASVDLALGARYVSTPVTDEMKAQLQALIDAAAPPPVIEGQTAAARPLASIPPLPEVDCSAPPTRAGTSSTSSTVSSTPDVSGSESSSGQESAEGSEGSVSTEPPALSDTSVLGTG